MESHEATLSFGTMLIKWYKFRNIQIETLFVIPCLGSYFDDYFCFQVFMKLMNTIGFKLGKGD